MLHESIKPALRDIINEPMPRRGHTLSYTHAYEHAIRLVAEMSYKAGELNKAGKDGNEIYNKLFPIFVDLESLVDLRSKRAGATDLDKQRAENLGHLLVELVGHNMGKQSDVEYIQRELAKYTEIDFEVMEEYMLACANP